MRLTISANSDNARREDVFGWWEPMKSSVRALVLLPILFCSAALAQMVRIEPDHLDGIYASGDTITFRITVAADAGLEKLTAQVLHNTGDTDSPAVPIVMQNNGGTVTTPAKAAGTVTLKVVGADAAGKLSRFYTGAAIDPFKIQPAAAAPDDFDAFWKAKIAQLAAIPMNAKCEPAAVPASANAQGVDYFHVTLDNINGTHVYGQLARPKARGKCPAMLIFQGAGVYPLPPENVLAPARDGWLVLNIMAHDLPVDLPIEKCQQLEQGELKNYPMIGNTNRDMSYFVRMFLGCYRAADYLAGRDDWDGKVLLSSGGSQGGLQAVVCGALYPGVTCVMTRITAGCDTIGNDIGRTTGWPGWYGSAANAKTPQEKAAIMATSRYFDAANFAPRVKQPTLVCMGLADLTSPPTGVLAMYNVLGGKKEICIVPAAGHSSADGSHEPMLRRMSAWTAALLSQSRKTQ